MKTKYIFFMAVSMLITQCIMAQTWSLQTSSTGRNLWGVYFVNQNLGFVCGDSGTVLKTTNGGGNWTTLNTGTTYHLAGLQFIDANIGYAMSWVDPGGIFLKTTNGGSTWNNISLNVSNAYSGGFWFFNADTGVMALGKTGYSQSRILKTVNGGTTWDTVYSGGNGWISFFYFADRNNGYATVSGGGVLKTSDGGSNWTLLTNLNNNLWMSGVYFFNKDTGFVGGGDYNAGGGKIYKTTNGGTTWTPHASNFGTSIMLFTSPNAGYAIGTNTSWTTKRIIKTTDGGNTWDYDITPVNNLNGITFPSAIVGYAVGDGGAILKWTAPVGMAAQPLYSHAVTIYPNPAGEKINLSIPDYSSRQIEVKIFNTLGQLVFSQTIRDDASSTLVISQLTQGVYLLRAEGDKLFEERKIIVAR